MINKGPVINGKIKWPIMHNFTIVRLLKSISDSGLVRKYRFFCYVVHLFVAELINEGNE